MSTNAKPIVQFTFPTPDRTGFEELEKVCDVRYSDVHLSEPEKALETLDKDAVVLVSEFTQPITAGLLGKMKELKLVANYAVGYNNIDLDYTRTHGITVANTPHAVVTSTAELTLAILLSLTRRVAEWDGMMRRQRSSDKGGLGGGMGHDLFGKKVGIIGFGNIGQRVGKLLQAFGCTILYNKRTRLTDAQEKEMGVTFATVDEILRRSDIISLHTPLNAESEHLLDAEAFGKMKPSAVVINLSRGPVVDEHALLDALKSGKIAGAGLDVFEFRDQPLDELYDLPNVVMTPHVGTQTYEARYDMRVELANNIIGFLTGDRNVSVVR